MAQSRPSTYKATLDSNSKADLTARLQLDMDYIKSQMNTLTTLIQGLELVEATSPTISGPTNMNSKDPVEATSPTIQPSAITTSKDPIEATSPTIQPSAIATGKEPVEATSPTTNSPAITTSEEPAITTSENPVVATSPTPAPIAADTEYQKLLQLAGIWHMLIFAA
ncbi:hypothetical protein UVI_02064400 [Ustilaginoidea virens]|uniref:Uncharacterized protein n=1 Tax=Ustilaginoidea virens TaxID=1159556 RepID=A0A1B5V8N9_USTVR|nr:hypothetical protein UVI_02064400 [Ustilaginoidea virens]